MTEAFAKAFGSWLHGFMSLLRGSIVSRAGLLVLAFLVGVGCAGNPATGVARNGRPLVVRKAFFSESHTEDRVSGTDHHYDASGNFTGATVHTQAETVSSSGWIYQLYLGDHPIDEQDFFHLSKDQSAYAEILDKRTRASRRQAIGLTTVLLSVAAIGTGLAIGGNGGWLALGGIGTGLVGWMVWYGGHQTLKEKQLMGLDRSSAAADSTLDCQGSLYSCP